MTTAILAIVLFVLLIFPHELGHFIAAKSVGVQVNEFAFGMGPAIWKKQIGETLYAIRVFPIGGYCAMEGEDEESDNPRAFNNKPAWAKILVLVAGSFMNVMIALVIMSIIMGSMGMMTTTIDSVAAGSPAETAGIMAGDKVVSVDGKEVRYWSDLAGAISSEDELTIVLKRNGEEVTVTAVPREEEGRYVIGITSRVTHDPYHAVKNGALACRNMFLLLGDSLRMIVQGEVSSNDLSGPVGMVSIIHDNQSQGLLFFFYLLSFISLNLALFNMLPLPALDGGRILFVIIRMITGKAISDQMEGMVHAVGMVLLIGLMVFVTWNDIVRLFS